MESYPKIDAVIEREGLHKVCKYAFSKRQSDMADPHRHKERDPQKKIYEDITECIGNTPIIKLKNIAKKEGIECELCMNLF